jgi:hypothetical protein
MIVTRVTDRQFEVQTGHKFWQEYLTGTTSYPEVAINQLFARIVSDEEYNEALKEWTEDTETNRKLHSYYNYNKNIKTLIDKKIKSIFRVSEKTGELDNGRLTTTKIFDFDSETDAINFAQAISNYVILQTK